MTANNAGCAETACAPGIRELTAARSALEARMQMYQRGGCSQERAFRFAFMEMMELMLTGKPACDACMAVFAAAAGITALSILPNFRVHLASIPQGCHGN
jgi:hypothetical protein